MMSRLRVYEVAREIGMDNKALVALLQASGATEVHNHMSAVGPDVVERLRRHLEKQKRPAHTESHLRPTVVRRSRKKELPPDPVDLGPVIAITRDMAALLSLTPLTGEEEAPGLRFRIEITPALDGLRAIDVHFRRTKPEWEGAAPEAELSPMFRAIAFGACHLLSAPNDGPAKAKREPNPLGNRDAHMREVIEIKIKTRITAAQHQAVSDVISGRRGYSNVLKESVAVRAHWARYHTGPGGVEIKRLWRQAHRRGGEGAKERTYKLKS